MLQSENMGHSTFSTADREHLGAPVQEQEKYKTSKRDTPEIRECFCHTTAAFNQLQMRISLCCQCYFYKEQL